MRFMMLMYPGEAPELGQMPDEATIAAMMAYNEELTKAGILLALDGLQASAKGARISWQHGQPTVTDGPFAEAKELVGGYWMIQVKSKAEAVEWARRCPAMDGQRVEVRQVFEMADFELPPDSTVHAQVERVSAGVEHANAQSS